MKLLKGWLGEKKTSISMFLSLSRKSYHRFHNVILPSNNGTTQIDHLIISVYGLFIVETKNRQGWIFGSEGQTTWTQSIYGQNYSFQNPLRQTFRQKKVLSEFLDIKETNIHTVVYFVGGSKFKTPMPSNVISSKLGRFIKNFKDELLSPQAVKQLTEVIQEHLSRSKLSNKDHKRSLRKRHASNTICPKCGAMLVERIAQKGQYTGSKFLGCESYPSCRFTKNL